jgi:hypothetical protein
MKSNDASRARVVSEISIDEAVKAIEHFAENYPDDRQSRFIADRLTLASRVIMTKVRAREMDELAAATAKWLPDQSVTKTVIGHIPTVTIGGCVSSGDLPGLSGVTSWIPYT